MKISDSLFPYQEALSKKNEISSLGKNLQMESKGADLKTFSRGTLYGDWKGDFRDAFTKELDKHAAPKGAAQGSVWAKGKTIDKTSELYAKALELESYFIREVMKSMKVNMGKGVFGEKSMAGEFYADMLFDKYTEKVTLASETGLADLIYLQTNELV